MPKKLQNNGIRISSVTFQHDMHVVLFVAAHAAPKQHDIKSIFLILLPPQIMRGKFLRVHLHFNCSARENFSNFVKFQIWGSKF